MNRNQVQIYITYMIKRDKRGKLLRSYSQPDYGGSVTSGLDHALEMACLPS